MIKVVYHTSLKKNARIVIGLSKASIEHREGMTIKEISQILDLHEVGLVILNGTLVRESAVIKDGDYIEIHPFVGGG